MGQCRNWFDKFRLRDFSLKYEPRSGRLNIVDDGQIKSDRHVTVREIEEMLKISKSTIDRHIFTTSWSRQNNDIWIPHELKEIHLTKRINACDLHLSKEPNDQFGCLLSSAEQIERSGQRKTARIDQS